MASPGPSPAEHQGRFLNAIRNCTRCQQRGRLNPYVKPGENAADVVARAQQQWRSDCVADCAMVLTIKEPKR